MQLTKITISELVFDGSLYPRVAIDSQHSAAIREAIRSGAKLPPIIVDRKSNRIIDGVHRWKANLAEYGPDHVIPVEFRTYKNEAALFLAATQLNATHGHNLSPYDRSHIAIVSERLKVDRDTMAGALNMTRVKFDKLCEIKRATVGGNGRRPMPVPLKCTIRHKAGQRLTQLQADANTRLGGMNQLFYVNQLITLLEADLLDTENRRLMTRLKHLGELLAGVKC